MKFSVRLLLAIIGLVFAVLSVASIASGDNLLWGLDSFPQTTPPGGMSIMVGLAYISMLGSVGLMWFRAFVVKHVDAQSHRIALVLSLVTIVLHILLIGYIRLWELDKPPSQLFTAEAWGVPSSASSVRAVICLVLGFPIQHWFARRNMAVEKNRWGVILGGLIALGSLTVVGHTAYQPPTWISHGMDFVHGVGASIWFGGLLGLVLYLRMAFRQRENAGIPARVLADFSSYALYSVIALAVSGVVMATVIKDDPLERESAFAKTLILKLALLLIPLALATWNRFRLVPQMSENPESEAAWATMRRTTIIEIAALVVILVVTGFLVLQSPVP
jgi:copper transport protein